MPRKRTDQAERINLFMVAKQVGVSPMTVSNVINGRGRVGEATAQRIREAIEELGYVPNIAARTLAGVKPLAVGLLYASAATPFLDAVLVAALKATTAHGIQLLVQAVDELDPAGALEAVRGSAASGADALLLVPPVAELLAGSPGFASLRMPAAAITTGGALPGLITCHIDNVAAMRELAGLVIAKGHERIGYVGGPSRNEDSGQRLEGFKLSLLDADLPFDAELVRSGRFTFEGGMAAAAELLALAHPPDAIIAANDDMAAGIIAEATRRGLRLPGDLAVAGFDDTLIATRTWPALTVVRQPIPEMTDRAMRLLIQAVQGKFSPRDEVFVHSVVRRASI